MIKLDNLYSNGAIFPAKRKIIIHGECIKDATVTFNNITKVCPDIEGHFTAEFPEMDYGGPYTLTVKTFDDFVEVKDIYVGEVILYAGQSNMMFKLHEGKDDYSYISDDKDVKIFTIDHVRYYEADEERLKSKDGWVLLKKELVPYLSSIAIQSAYKIRQEKKCKVGLICCCQGASVIESWLPKEVLKKEDIKLEKSKKHFDHNYPFYQIWNSDSLLYNICFSLVKPYPVSAVVWYQGESDTAVDEAKIYDKELKYLISSWRKDFINEEIPFIIVQINDFDLRNDDGWHLIQKAQEKVALETENTYLVKAKDYCANESSEIHPPKKHDLALAIADKFLSI